MVEKRVVKVPVDLVVDCQSVWSRVSSRLGRLSRFNKMSELGGGGGGGQAGGGPGEQ